MGNVLVKTCRLAVKEGWERARKEMKKQNQRKADRDRGFKSFFKKIIFMSKETVLATMQTEIQQDM